jgi:hypothetical protein
MGFLRPTRYWDVPDIERMIKISRIYGKWYCLFIYICPCGLVMMGGFAQVNIYFPLIHPDC